jgi:hypothetical protein
VGTGEAVAGAGLLTRRPDLVSEVERVAVRVQCLLGAVGGQQGLSQGVEGPGLAGAVAGLPAQVKGLIELIDGLLVAA